jgi:acetate kinase
LQYRALTAEGLKRYGFHGLSYEYIAAALPAQLGDKADGRVVVAHLGNGSSMCALCSRKSIASSMGFSTLDGLVMGTRCGSLDPGVVLYLLQEKKMRVEELSDLLYKRSGLLGVSGISSDMKALMEDSRPEAKEAIDLYTYRIARELASLAVAIGGLDALVFTGGIGEHAPEIREAVCQRVKWLGVDLDDGANRAGLTHISTPQSTVSVWVIPTDEKLMVARHAARLTRDPSIHCTCETGRCSVHCPA